MHINVSKTEDKKELLSTNTTASFQPYSTIKPADVFLFLVPNQADKILPYLHIGENKRCSNGKLILFEDNPLNLCLEITKTI